STLRLTVGVLLAEQLSIALRRVGSSGNRFTFSGGEMVLSDWMAENARVCWAVNPQPWVAESQLIGDDVLPLNLDQNTHISFHAQLTQARARQRQQARSLPALPRQTARSDHGRASHTLLHRGHNLM